MQTPHYHARDPWQSSQTLVCVVRGPMVVSPPQLGFRCRLLKEDLGRIIWINIPIHKSTDVTTEQMKT
jgi:hypothetical protein